MSIALASIALPLADKYRTEIIPNQTWRLTSIHTAPQTLGFVVVRDWSCLAVISGEALPQGFHIVIGALYERFTRYVIDARFFGWANSGQNRVSV